MRRKELCDKKKSENFIEEQMAQVRFMSSYDWIFQDVITYDDVCQSLLKNDGNCRQNNVSYPVGPQ